MMAKKQPATVSQYALGLGDQGFSLVHTLDDILAQHDVEPLIREWCSEDIRLHEFQSIRTDLTIELGSNLRKRPRQPVERNNLAFTPDNIEHCRQRSPDTATEIKNTITAFDPTKLDNRFMEAGCVPLLRSVHLTTLGRCSSIKLITNGRSKKPI